MSTKTNKLKTKDLIVAGAFAALYVVVLFAVVTVMGFVPILYLIAPFVNSVILGCIYMMYVTKVPKTGAIFNSFGRCRSSHLHRRRMGISDLVPHPWNCGRVNCPCRKS